MSGLSSIEGREDVPREGRRCPLPCEAPVLASGATKVAGVCSRPWPVG